MSCRKNLRPRYKAWINLVQNIFTFIPKNLWKQFQKAANVYFLMLAVLQSIPQVSVTGGVPTILLPLGFVMALSGFKDLIEDLKRRKSDKIENNRAAHVRKNNEWGEKRWQEVKVGDILKVCKDESFPADLILLSTSDSKGVCYIETKNLDGETNLKHKISLKQTQVYFEDHYKFDGFQGEVKCEDKNHLIYQFNGIITIQGEIYALSNEQFLLRGSSLKNTEWITGVVVYTGHETKIMLNSSKTRSKFSKLEKQMGIQVIFVFFLQIILCGISTGYYIYWFNSNENATSYYLDLENTDDNLVVQFIYHFFSWVLIFANFIPIALIVTLEMVKFVQAIFISWDIKMYYEPIDMKTGVQSSNLNEDLGQISYIFSDKTGTLTCNIMEFRKMSVNGISYGTNENYSGPNPIPHTNFVDSSFNSNDQAAQEFLIHLAICHTILTVEKDGVIQYKASSPDELALVNAAKFFGVTFMGRDQDNNVLINANGKEEKIKILNVLEFTSDRKRMSVIARMPNGMIKLLCKGADSILLPRILQSPVIESTWKHLEDYANDGLRTLLISSRTLGEEEYHEWNFKFQEAMRDVLNREKRVFEVGELIESKLTLLGATAIEDKLQDKVPEAIQCLRESGIKVWVLTGDKMETAINIGFSCSLLSSEMARIVISAIHTEDVKDEINKAILLVKAHSSTEFALVITGEALLKAMRKEFVPDLLLIVEKCQVVLACRVSPQQKADIVKLIKDNKPGVRTLSIGDGANDVNMINAAHVGIGISGLEGQQAVRASDYSIAQFSYLKRLILAHGRECYRKNATLVCYNFYKNALVILPLFFYGIFSAFSAQAFYNFWTYSMYNKVFTSLPICLYAVFDREMDYEVLQSSPSYYRPGLNNELFNMKLFWLWMLEAIYQSVIILIISLYSLCAVSGQQDTGLMDNMWVASTLVYGLIVIVVNIKICMLSYQQFWFSWVAVTISIASYFATTKILLEIVPMKSWLDNYDSRGAFTEMMTNPNSYVSSIVIIYASLFLGPVIRNCRELIKTKREKTQRAVIDSSVGFKSSPGLDEEAQDIVPDLPPDEFEAAQQTLYHFTRKHTGFAFSSEGVLTMDPNFYSK
ncbi:unnamed protein product [Blepharisma stoltei]|uniref:Phospholipid-transporting ATPase n=1 Tax=Blepharisma stoltei TaxID=1481888 RepID=A0AAU9JXE1_9CILI|nr:unnamed protein product [Blepharisma stoltei]